MHSRTLRRMPGLSRYYASRDAGRAGEFNRELNGTGAFASYEAAIADPRVHAVLVATPPNLHLELVTAALAARKHVIVEKPAFLASADFDAVARDATQADRQVCVAENYYYKPIARRLRSLVAEGAFGEVRYVIVNALKRQETSDWRGDAAVAGGGALFEGGVHWVNFMANIGLDVTRIEARRPGGTKGLERSMLLVFDYADGAVGTLAHSWEIRSPLKGVRLSGVFGTAGSATFESNGLGLLVLGKRTRLALPGVRDFLGYGAMFDDFLEAIRRNREPAMTLALARRDVELVELAYRSAARDG